MLSVTLISLHDRYAPIPGGVRSCGLLLGDSGDKFDVPQHTHTYIQIPHTLYQHRSLSDGKNLAHSCLNVHRKFVVHHHVDHAGFCTDTVSG